MEDQTELAISKQTQRMDRKEHEDQTESDLEMETNFSPPKPSKNVRRNRRWAQEDSEKVIAYFNNFIDDLDSLTTSKGGLPSKKAVEKFLQSCVP